MTITELGFGNGTMSAVGLLCHLEEMSEGSFSRAGVLPFNAKPERKLFKCPNCGRDYIHQKSLRQHMKHECGKEPQFQCPYCPKKTKLKGNMKQHIILVHKGSLERNQQSKN